jgi:hypothetical protein
MNASLDRDERTVVVENASFRWAYQFVSFGLLVLVGYRSFARGEAAWDLMALVVLGGVVASAYQWSQRVLTVRWAVHALAGMFVAAVIAALIVLLRS